MAKKGKPKADSENKAPTGTNDAGETAEAPRGKKQKKVYN
jgi:hypothetical protein